MRGAFDFHVGSFLFSVSFPQGSKENGSRVRSRQVSFVLTLRAGSGELLILASALCEDTLWNRVVAALVPFQTSKIPRISKIRLSKAALVLAAQFFATMTSKITCVCHRRWFLLPKNTHISTTPCISMRTPATPSDALPSLLLSARSTRTLTCVTYCLIKYI